MWRRSSRRRQGLSDKESELTDSPDLSSHKFETSILRPLVRTPVGENGKDRRWDSLYSTSRTRSSGRSSDSLMCKRHRSLPRVTRTISGDTSPEQKVLLDLQSFITSQQHLLEKAEWGDNTRAVKFYLRCQRQQHKSIVQFGRDIDKAGFMVNLMDIPCAFQDTIPTHLKKAFQDDFERISEQYNNLLPLSNQRLTSMEQLAWFSSQAERLILWLEGKEKHEVNYDWSQSNIRHKRDAYLGLLQDLEKQEVELTVVQKEGEKLLNQFHPAVHTIEEILFEVEKKWRWVLQLCHCIFSHVQENTAYWQFFRDAHAAEKVLRELHKLIKMMMVHPPGPHKTLRKQIQGIQERIEEMEVIVQSLSNKSTEIVQLKPRCPDNLIASLLPLKAVCDYTLNGMLVCQREHVYLLKDNKHRVSWLVLLPGGVEIIVPSVCYTILPPNKHAINISNRIQEMLTETKIYWIKCSADLNIIQLWYLLQERMSRVTSWTIEEVEQQNHNDLQEVMDKVEKLYNKLLESRSETGILQTWHYEQMNEDMSTCRRIYKNLIISLGQTNSIPRAWRERSIRLSLERRSQSSSTSMSPEPYSFWDKSPRLQSPLFNEGRTLQRAGTLPASRELSPTMQYWGKSSPKYTSDDDVFSPEPPHKLARNSMTPTARKAQGQGKVPTNLDTVRLAMDQMKDVMETPQLQRQAAIQGSEGDLAAAEQGASNLKQMHEEPRDGVIVDPALKNEAWEEQRLHKETHLSNEEECLEAQLEILRRSVEEARAGQERAETEAALHQAHSDELHQKILQVEHKVQKLEASERDALKSREEALQEAERLKQEAEMAYQREHLGNGEVGYENQAEAVKLQEEVKQTRMELAQFEAQLQQQLERAATYQELAQQEARAKEVAQAEAMSLWRSAEKEAELRKAAEVEAQELGVVVMKEMERYRFAAHEAEEARKKLQEELCRLHIEVKSTSREKASLEEQQIALRADASHMRIEKDQTLAELCLLKAKMEAMMKQCPKESSFCEDFIDELLEKEVEEPSIWTAKSEVAFTPPSQEKEIECTFPIAITTHPESTSIPSCPDQGLSQKPPCPDQGLSLNPPYFDEELSRKPLSPDQVLSIKSPSSNKEFSLKPLYPDQDLSLKPTFPNQELSLNPPYSDELSLNPPYSDELSLKPPCANQELSPKPPYPDQKLSRKPPLPNQELSLKSPCSNDELSLKSLYPDLELSQKPPLPNHELSLKPSCCDQELSVKFLHSNDELSLKSPYPDQELSLKSPCSNEELSLKSLYPDQKLSRKPPLPNQELSLKPSCCNQELSVKFLHSNDELSLKSPYPDQELSLKPPGSDEELSFKPPYPDQGLYLKPTCPDQELSLKPPCADQDLSIKLPCPNQGVCLNYSMVSSMENSSDSTSRSSQDDSPAFTSSDVHHKVNDLPEVQKAGRCDSLALDKMTTEHVEMKECKEHAEQLGERTLSLHWELVDNELKLNTHKKSHISFQSLSSTPSPAVEKMCCITNSKIYEKNDQHVTFRKLETGDQHGLDVQHEENWRIRPCLQEGLETEYNERHFEIDDDSLRHIMQTNQEACGDPTKEKEILPCTLKRTKEQGIRFIGETVEEGNCRTVCRTLGNTDYDDVENNLNASDKKSSGSLLEDESRWEETKLETLNIYPVDIMKSDKQGQSTKDEENDDAPSMSSQTISNSLKASTEDLGNSTTQSLCDDENENVLSRNDMMTVEADERNKTSFQKTKSQTIQVDENKAPRKPVAQEKHLENDVITFTRPNEGKMLNSGIQQIRVDMEFDNMSNVTKQNSQTLGDKELRHQTKGVHRDNIVNQYKQQSNSITFICKLGKQQNSNLGEPRIEELSETSLSQTGSSNATADEDTKVVDEKIQNLHLGGSDSSHQLQDKDNKESNIDYAALSNVKYHKGEKSHLRDDPGKGESKDAFDLKSMICEYQESFITPGRKESRNLPREPKCEVDCDVRVFKGRQCSDGTAINETEKDKQEDKVDGKTNPLEIPPDDEGKEQAFSTEEQFSCDGVASASIYERTWMRAHVHAGERTHNLEQACQEDTGIFTEPDPHLKMATMEGQTGDVDIQEKTLHRMKYKLGVTERTNGHPRDETPSRDMQVSLDSESNMDLCQGDHKAKERHLEHTIHDDDDDDAETKLYSTNDIKPRKKMPFTIVVYEDLICSEAETYYSAGGDSVTRDDVFRSSEQENGSDSHELPGFTSFEEDNFLSEQAHASCATSDHVQGEVRVKNEHSEGNAGTCKDPLVQISLNEVSGNKESISFHDHGHQRSINKDRGDTSVSGTAAESSLLNEGKAQYVHEHEVSEEFHHGTPTQERQRTVTTMESIFDKEGDSDVEPRSMSSAKERESSMEPRSTSSAKEGDSAEESRSTSSDKEAGSGMEPRSTSSAKEGVSAVESRSTSSDKEAGSGMEPRSTLSDKKGVSAVESSSTSSDKEAGSGMEPRSTLSVTDEETRVTNYSTLDHAHEISVTQIPQHDNTRNIAFSLQAERETEIGENSEKQIDYCENKGKFATVKGEQEFTYEEAVTASDSSSKKHRLQSPEEPVEGMKEEHEDADDHITDASKSRKSNSQSHFREGIERCFLESVPVQVKKTESIFQAVSSEVVDDPDISEEPLIPSPDLRRGKGRKRGPDVSETVVDKTGVFVPAKGSAAVIIQDPPTKHSAAMSEKTTLTAPDRLEDRNNPWDSSEPEEGTETQTRVTTDVERRGELSSEGLVDNIIGKTVFAPNTCLVIETLTHDTTEIHVQANKSEQLTSYVIHTSRDDKALMDSCNATTPIKIGLDSLGTPDERRTYSEEDSRADTRPLSHQEERSDGEELVHRKETTVIREYSEPPNPPSDDGTATTHGLAYNENKSSMNRLQGDQNASFLVSNLHGFNEKAGERKETEELRITAYMASRPNRKDEEKLTNKPEATPTQNERKSQQAEMKMVEKELHKGSTPLASLACSTGATSRASDAVNDAETPQAETGNKRCSQKRPDALLSEMNVEVNENDDRENSDASACISNSYGDGRGSPDSSQVAHRGHNPVLSAQHTTSLIHENNKRGKWWKTDDLDQDEGIKYSARGRPIGNKVREESMQSVVHTERSSSMSEEKCTNPDFFNSTERREVRHEDTRGSIEASREANTRYVHEEISRIKAEIENITCNVDQTTQTNTSSCKNISKQGSDISPGPLIHSKMNESSTQKASHAKVFTTNKSFGMRGAREAYLKGGGKRPQASYSQGAGMSKFASSDKVLGKSTSQTHPSEVVFQGLRAPISINQLESAHLIDRTTADQLREGRLSPGKISLQLSSYLKGSRVIAGIIIEKTRECLSVHEAMQRKVLRPGCALQLLEAQAATGFIIEPVSGRKLSVTRATWLGMVAPKFYEKLLSAEGAVTGYLNPKTSEHVSLFEALRLGIILPSHGMRLLEAQLATGGLIDPAASHRLPLSVALARGLIDVDVHRSLCDPSNDCKGFFDPNTDENLTYAELQKRCVHDHIRNLLLLPVHSK